MPILQPEQQRFLQGQSAPALAFSPKGDALVAWLVQDQKLFLWQVASRWKLPGRSSVVHPIKVRPSIICFLTSYAQAYIISAEDHDTEVWSGHKTG